MSIQLIDISRNIKSFDQLASFRLLSLLSRTLSSTASAYVRLVFYLTSAHGRTAKIEREIHVVDSLAAKALIGIDILSPERISVDLGNNCIRIGSCGGLEIPISVLNRGERKNVSVFSEKKMRIPSHTKVAVPVMTPKHKPLKTQLPKDRDFLFEPKKLDSLSVFAHIVDYDTSQVFIQNDTDREITLPRINDR